jgi:histidinol-phosphate aminotransferase
MNQLRLNPHLLTVPLYVAGRPIEEVQEEYGLTDVIKLASNENPLGASPLAVAAFQRTLADANRYPGTGDRHLREKLAAWYNARCGGGFKREHFLTGNGISDILRMIFESFVFAESGNGRCAGEVVYSTPTFPLYRILAQRYGGACIPVPHRAYHHDLPAMREAITPDTRLVILCNPNNPTGTVIGRGEVEEFLAAVPPQVVVVFDESYYELVEDAEYSNAHEYVLGGRDQVLLLRGFSKVHGLAGLRIGYAVGTPAMIEYLHHAQLVFNTGDPVMYAAMAALDDAAHLDRVRALIHAERQFLYRALSDLDIAFVPTEANFILLVDLPREAAWLEHELLKRGVIVRVPAGFGLPDALRVTIGTHAENERFVAALRDTLEL